MTRRDLDTIVSFEELAAMHDLLDTLESAEVMAEKGIQTTSPTKGAKR